MKLSTFSVIWTVIYIGYGLGLLFTPNQLMGIYGLTFGSSGMIMARALGASLTAFAITYWLNRDVAATDTGWHNLLLASFIYNIIATPIVLMAIFGGVMTSMGWTAVGLHIFLAATFGYFTFKK